MVSKKVLIYGWYNHGNIGDDLFSVVFTKMFPGMDLHFVDAIPDDCNSYDALIIGGGSFLDKAIHRLEMVTIPMAFVGVGTEAVHPTLLPFLEKAKIVISRDVDGAGVQASDLAYAADMSTLPRSDEQLTVLMNNNFSPMPNSPEWVTRSWDWFCSEFAQAMDRLYEKHKLPIVFYPMCLNNYCDDRRAAAPVIDRMVYKNHVKFIADLNDHNFDELMAHIVKSKLVISHRLHGMILSDIVSVPFVGISGHDKMEVFSNSIENDVLVPYYGFNMKRFVECVDNAFVVSPDQQARLEGNKAQWQNLLEQIKVALAL